MRSAALIVLFAALLALPVAGQPPKPLTAEQKERIKERDTLLKAATDLEKAGKFAESVAAVEKLLAIEREVFGKAHAEVAGSLNRIGRMRVQLEDWAGARIAYRERLEIWTTLYGKDDWRATDARLALADVDLYEKMTPDDRAIVWKSGNLNAVGIRLRGQYEIREAEPLFKEAIAGRRKALGDAHPDTLQSMKELALVYYFQARYADAEPLYKEALAGCRKALGDAHPNTLQSLNGLADVYLGQRRYADAEPLFKEAIAGQRKALGVAHPNTLQSIDSLVVLYVAQGRHADAEPLYKEALAGQRKALGDAHLETLRGIGNLAGLYHAQGRYAEAETLRKEALAGCRKALGDAHPDTLQSLHALAELYRDQGRYADAAPLYKEILALTRAHLDREAVDRTESNQLGLRDIFRRELNWALSFGRAARRPAAEWYAEVLAWKGAAFARRSQLRAAVEKSGDPDLAKLFTDAADVARRFANLSSSTPPPDQLAAYRKTLSALANRKAEIDRELSRRSEPFRTARAAAALTPDQLAEALPTGVALVDILEYTHYAADPDRKGDWKDEKRFLAYVIRQGQPVVEVELGLAEPIDEAVSQWRDTVGRTKPIRDEKDPAVTLRKKVWEPVAKHLAGAKVVLISPDGALARLPFAALPGSDPEKYLVEEVAVTVIPVPQLLPEMLAAKREAPRDASLLLVGDVDYDADAGKAEAGTTARTAERGGAARQWQRLAATRDEVAAVADSFGKRFAGGRVDTLRTTRATEAAVRQLAGKHQFLHVATHGFFTPPKPETAGRPRGGFEDDLRAMRAGLADFHPGLLSGLVLAGANRPPRADADDGILTALEVEDLDLSGVELVVLSACETRLGKEVGAEGLLGLERAFLAAGARTTAATLWKIPDKATEVLMVRFYRNLWEKKMPKLEALREAQLWMLREGAKEPGLTRGATADGPELVEKGGRLPPYYWAAFTLSGDWR